MIFNSKQLEELENNYDSSNNFEEDGEDSNNEDVGEGAMEWRRGMIEEGAESVKRAKTRPVDPEITYEIKSLLFDRESRRFCRVLKSVPGYLKVGYLTGGDREYGQLDIKAFLLEHGPTKKLKELAEQLDMPEAEVQAELDEHGITPIADEGADASLDYAELAAADPGLLAGLGGDKNGKGAKAKAAEKASKPKSKASAAAKKADDKAPAAKAKAAPKNKKKAPAAKAAPAGKKAAAAKAKPSGKAKTGKGAPNPIDDPNGFIKQNFMEMSNREMARVTGLSEHTIRRKLGEWGLKRKR